MTASEIAWWTPTWKRMTLMGIFALLGTLGVLWNSVFVVAWCCGALGYYWHQMMTAWPPAPQQPIKLSGMLDP